jgi:peptidoglycan/LPS O-acetylase OafA/YrhL
MKTKNVPALTGLRFFAASAIVLLHSAGMVSLDTWPFQLDGIVQLFFVLSGFVLTIGMSDERPYADFLVGRIARVWPCHLAALVFLAAVINPDTHDYWTKYWTPLGGQGPEWVSVFLLQAWVPQKTTYFSYNGVAWSLSVEMFCYAIFPGCIVALKRWPTALSGIFFVVTAFVVSVVNLTFPSLNPQWLGFINPATNLSVFVLGVAAGLIFRQLPRSTTSFAWSSLIETVAVIFALTANTFFRLVHPHWMSVGLLSFLSEAGGAPAYALLIFALARYFGVIGAFLSWRPIVFLGESSFALYLFHQLLLKWYYASPSTFALTLGELPAPLRYAGYWVACITIAAAAHLIIERPARRLILSGWQWIRRPEKRSVPAETYR